MDDENPRKRINAEVYYEFADNGYVTPQPYLGLNILDGENAIYLSTTKYADTIAKRFGLTPAPISTPCRYTAGNHQEKSNLLGTAGLRDYQRKLGCLLFAAVTCRPDLSYSASQLATHLKRPEAEHMAELADALHYLVSTPTIGLTYHKTGTTTPKLIGYVDADCQSTISLVGYIGALLIGYNTSRCRAALQLLALPAPPHVAPCCSPRVALCCSAPHALLQPARRALLPCASRPAAASASRPTAASASHCAALRVAPCCSQRVVPYCSQRVAPCCPVRRALLQPAHRALLQPMRRTLLPCTSRPAAASALRPTASSASPSAAPRIVPCCPVHRALCPAAHAPPSHPGATTDAAAARATAAAGGGAAESAAGVGGAAGSGGAGPTTSRHYLSWRLSRKLQWRQQSQHETFSPHVLSELVPQRCVTGSVEAAPLDASESTAALGASESAAALGASESAAAQGASESAAALGASESSAAPYASESTAALGARASPTTSPSSAEALHNFTLDSGASRCFFRDCTTLAPLAAPVQVSLADPTGGPVVARASTVLPYPAIPSGSLSGLHLPAFSTNLVSNAAIQDVRVDTFIPGGQCVVICTCSQTGCHLATFTRRPGSSLYTLTTASAQVAEAGQTLLWHHRLGHPSQPRRRGMHSRLLVSGLPRSLPSLPRSPAPPCLPCIEGRQRAAPHSSEFPPTTTPLQTLHMDVWASALVGGTDQECYFLLVVDDYTRYTSVFPLRCKANRPRPHSSGWERLAMSVFWVWGVLSLVCDAKASKLSSCTLRCVFLGFPTDSPLWQLYHPRSHRVFSSQDVTFDESVCYYRLHPHTSHPVPLAPLFLVPVPPPPVHPLPPQRPAPSGVSQVDPPPLVEPLEISSNSYGPAEGGDLSADDTAATRCSPRLETPPGFPPRPSSSPLQPAAVDYGAENAGAELGGAETEGEGSGGAVPGGAAIGGAGFGGAATRGAGSWGATTGGADSGGRPSPGAGHRSLTYLRRSCRRRFVRGSFGRSGGGYGLAGIGAASPGGTTGAGGVVGAGGTRGAASAGGARDTSPRGATGAGGAGPTSLGGTAGGGSAGGAAGAGGAGAGGTRGAGAAGPGGARTKGAGAAGAGGGAGAGGAGGATGATGTGGAGGTTSARGPGAAGASGAVGAGGAGGAAEAAGAGGAGATGAGGARAAGTALRRPFFYPRPQSSLPPPDSLLPGSPLPALAPHNEVIGSLTEHREPETRASTPVRARRVAHPRPPGVPGTHGMALRPSSVPQRVVLPEPPTSSLLHVPDPESDLARATSSIITRLLATVVTDTDLEYTAAFALVIELGDPDALDIPNPRSYAEAIAGEYSSQWQTAMDAEMGSWKSTGTYVNEVPPPGANIVDGMWIFRVKRPTGSPPAFKARYVARGFSQRHGVDFFHTFSPTPKMTTLRLLLHVVAQRDYELHSLEFSTAFLQGSLHEEIWLRCPPGFTGTTLAALGFAPSSADPSLFLRTDTTLPPFDVLVYVDDLVFATADTGALALEKAELQERHTCTDLAPSSDESIEPSGPNPELVGCLIYLMTCTRPDLAYPLCLLARYVAPGRHQKGSLVLTRHSDSSWADDQVNQRSSQGYTFSLGSSSVWWRSTCSSSVLSSSCEAEIYARAMAAHELCSLTYLLTDLGERPRSPPILYVKNKAMLASCHDQRLEHRTKHIALRYFRARELK
ncbi:unnamed protein product [Closterium sp. NIES-53]